MSASLPTPIKLALRELPSALSELGVVPTSSRRPEAFENFEVTFQRRGQIFTVARDRGQFIVNGPTRGELERAGLWRAFPGVRELQPVLVAWLASKEGPNNSSKPTPLRGAA